MKLTIILKLFCVCCCKKISQRCKLKKEVNNKPWKKLNFNTFKNFKFKVTRTSPSGTEDDITSNFLWILNEYHTIDYEDNILLEYEIINSFFPSSSYIKIKKFTIEDENNTSSIGIIGLINKEVTNLNESFGQITIIQSETPPE